MENIGSEIGQKMRSAVKAKLLELGTGGSAGYIDDELPDYVMIMVANKRSKQQMTADLNLFLGDQTELFVTWLHEVLQKLQEVTLPATNVLPKKRKSSQKDDGASKKDKKSTKKDRKSTKKTTDEESSNTSGKSENIIPGINSITDVFAEELLEKAKKNMTETTEMSANIKKTKTHKASEANASMIQQPANEQTNMFDIPTITEIATSDKLDENRPSGSRAEDLAKLAEIQKKIYQAKRHLKLLGELDEDVESEDGDYLNLKDDGSADEFDESGDLVKKPPKPAETRKRSPITFDAAQQNKDKPVVATAKEAQKPRQPIEPPTAKLIPTKLGPEENSFRRAPNEKQKTESVNLRRSRSRERDRDRDRERERRDAPVELSRKRSIHERLGLREAPRETSREQRAARQPKELYVPAFRRRELEQNQTPNRERERERDRGRRNDRSYERDRDRDRHAKLDRDREPRNRSALGERKQSSDNADKARSDESKSPSPKRNLRIGSRVIVAPPKPIESSDSEDLQDKPINSVIKIKPRAPVSPSKQACKNLLMRAVAEAQRSTILATPNQKDSKTQATRTTESPSGERATKLYTKSFRSRDGTAGASAALFRRTTQNLVIEVGSSLEGKARRKLIQQTDHIEIKDDDDEDDEYVPDVPGDRYESSYEYVPSSMNNDSSNEPIGNRNDDTVASGKMISNTQFVVTLNEEKVPAKFSKRMRSQSSSPRRDHRNSSPIHNGVKGMPASLQRTRSRAIQQQNHSGKSSSNVATTSKITAKRTQERGSSSSYTPPSNRRSQHTTKDVKKIVINNNDTDDDDEFHQQKKQSSPVNNRKKTTETDLRSTTPPLPPKLKRLATATSSTSISANGTSMTAGDDDRRANRSSVTPPPPSPHTPAKRRRTPIKFEIEREEKPARDDRSSTSKRRSRNDDRDERDSSGERHEERGDERRKISIRNAEAKKYDNIPSLSSVALDSAAIKVVKPREKCKYHPNCTKQFCEFYHPSAPCKSFPNCKYADKCMYSHPKCKYDMACTSLDCNFSHSGVRNPSQLQPTVPPLSSHVVPVQNYKTISATPPAASTTMCKYYPNCTKVGCTFYHPKPCRFGKNCINKLECNFYHHELQSSNKFKWVASLG